MPVVLAQPHEHVGDQQHGDRREQEGQRGRPADEQGGALRVDVGGHARRHQRDRDADGLPDGQAGTQSSFADGCGHVDSPVTRSTVTALTLLASSRSLYRLVRAARQSRREESWWTSRNATPGAPAPRAWSPGWRPGRWWRSPPRSWTTPGSPGSRRCRWTGCRSWRRGASGSRPRSTTSASTTGSRRRRSGEAPVGDQRIIPDLDRVVTLAAQPGWAWSPGERWSQDRRAAHARQPAAAAAPGRRARVAGRQVQSAFEIEWVVSRGDGDGFTPAARGAGYGMSRLVEASEYCRDVIDALTAQGVVVEQLHPEYAAGQFELSVAPEDPSRRPTPRCWCARRSAASARRTASARRSPRRSTPRASATAATCT